MAIPLSQIERTLEGVKTPPVTRDSLRLPWPDEKPGPYPYPLPPAGNAPESPSGSRGRAGEHWSATQLQMALRCPEQWRRRYLLGERERPGAALIQGGADHKAHEHNFRQKIQSERDLPVGDVTDAFDQAWRDKIDEAGGVSEIEWGDDKPDQLKTQAGKLVALYHHEASPLIQPLAVEEEFYLNLPGVRLPVKGYLDVRVDGAVIDRKTTKKRTTLAMKPDWRLQGRIYAAHAQEPVWFHQAIKTQTPKIDTSSVVIDKLTDREQVVLAGRVALAEQMVDRFIADLGPDQPWPGAETHPWACNYCGWRPTCFWWAT
jgi:hypothetical protein